MLNPTSTASPGWKGSKAQWARDHDLTPNTLMVWQRDYRFRSELDHRISEVNVNPLRVQEVVDAMHREAAQGNTQAAKLYLEYVRFLSPPRQIDFEGDAAEMTDVELADAIKALRSQV